ncbi:motility associated factor glycosyltransferase family protein [Alkalihalobacillus sp. AL-G]|uniref:motility associated factor glycosyltransferase family protein n=1 Tax=Alkalihalobacillus sp. AL-G TaxID=2926399 RepID=UPI0027299457|nr:6-hydroxymethylpterin diphosphokinase MptE-like protein [Alkalihalobacillus sp. AL-G]WLD92970.1 DUF115 domain-containing protein [Alkalihalobacillus sp. AL-G]
MYSYKDSTKKVPLNSLYSPSLEANRFIKKLDKNNRKVYIFIGIGNSTLIKNIIKNTRSYIHLYIIEPFEQVLADSEFIDLVKTSRNVTFEYYKNWFMLDFMTFIEKFNSTDTEIIIHPHYEKTKTGHLKEIINKLNQGIKLVTINNNTERRFRKDWILEPLLNLQYTMGAHSIKELKDKYRGKSAILAASGPSLKENMTFLKEAQNSAYIFAAGSAVNGLTNNGIIPDFVTSFDSGDINYDTHFKESNYKGPLIAGSVINSNILKHHEGPIIYAQLTLDDITRRVIKDKYSFPPVPSVAVFTLQIMQFLGFSKIYLVGQDLAYINGKYYAQGVNETDASKKVNADITVKSNNGGMVDTSYSLYSFLESFEFLINHIDQNEMTIYNTSRNGAYIKGTTFVEPNSINISDELGIKDIALDLKAAQASEAGINEGLKIIDELEEFSETLHDANKSLSRLNPKAVSITDIKKVSKIFSTLRNHTIFEDIITQRMSSIVQRIRNLFLYKLDDNQTTNDDRIMMVEEIQRLVTSSEKFIESLLNDNRVIKYKAQYKDKQNANPV